MPMNPVVIISWDLVQTPEQQKEYAEFVPWIVNWLLDQPGVVEFRSYRRADGASPLAVGMVEFSSVEAAQAYLGSEASRQFWQEIRARGAVNMSSMLVANSPYATEPFRKG